MGSSSSLLGASNLSSSRNFTGSKGSFISRTKRRLSSFFCGSFTSFSAYEMHDCSLESSINDAKKIAPVICDSQDSSVESSLRFSFQEGNAFSIHENGSSSGRTSTHIDEASVDSSYLPLQTNEDRTDNADTIESLPFQLQPARELVSPNRMDCIAVGGVNDAMKENMPFRCSDTDQSRSLSPGIDVLNTHSSNIEHHQDAVLDENYPVISDSLPSYQMNGDDHFQTISSSPIFDQDSGNGLDLIPERTIGGGFDDRGRSTTFCLSGLHPNGTCSCDSFLTDEESNTLESISRIVMLAEALFEVLDEIHRQSLSLPLSTFQHPAPESLVDSFPLKHYKKLENNESNSSTAHQCYVCLADYEDEDALRVLPCNHEYHMSCIDKWLKEVNRVCPLCRNNVCDSAGEGSARDPFTFTFTLT